MKWFAYLTLLLILSGAESVTLNRGNGSEPDSLNPHLAQGLNSHHILYDLYEGLFRYGVDGKPVLAMASGYQVSNDGLVWAFTLREDAKWSNGDQVVAQNFVQAWQKAYDPKTAAPYRDLLEQMVLNDTLQVKALSSQQLELRLNQANPMLPSQLLLPIFMPQHQDENTYNGAYQLSDWRLQERITLGKNTFHHEADTVAFDEVVYWVTENQNSELNRFRAGELDITETIPDAKIEWLKQEMPKQLRIAPYFGTFFLGLDVRDPRLKNQQLRQALSEAIDREILVEKVLKSGQQAAFSLIPGGQRQQLNIKKAQQLLKASGFDVHGQRLTLLYNSSQNQKKVALAVAAMWRQNLAVKTRLINQEWKVFVSSRKKTGKQVFRGGWIADYLDPMNFLQLFQSQSQFNYSGYESASYDEILAQIPHASLENKKHLIQQAESILAEDVPMIPLYHYVSRHLVRENILGYEDNLLDQHLSRYIYQIQSSSGEHIDE